MTEKQSVADAAWRLAEQLYTAHCIYHGHGDGSRWNEEPYASRHSWANIARTAMSQASPPPQDEVEIAAKAMQNAELNDGEGNTYRLFDLLDFSGENKAVTITRQLARAALTAMKGTRDE